ncbi:acyltransferase [Sphaerisporangium sp. NPDC051011]|uniref:acyltransferase family protein n=1 Tax=Sphaerisporangium sp. NPDC051011 TaxID=3155792 RepID=UPI0033D7AED3
MGGPTRQAQRLPSLTGLRWFAAFAVFGFHLYHSPVRMIDPSVETVLRVLFGPGSVGVPFFFILSGFVLTWSARPGDRVAAFWRRRAARVVPNHVVTWLAVLAVLAAAGRVPTPGPTLTGLVLLQAWIPVEAYYYAVNVPAWSLSCEMAFYALFPVLLPLLRRVPGQRLWMVAALLLAGIWVVPFFSLPMSAELAEWWVWVFPITRVLEFALGVTVALMIKDGRWRGPGLAVSAALALAAYLTQPFVWEAWQRVAWMAAPLALLVAAAATSDLAGRRSWLQSPVMIWLGEISFAFYLVHQPVIRFGARALAGDRPSPLVLLAAGVGMLALAIVLSWLLYRLIEHPLERRLGRPRRTSPAVSGSRPG